LRELQDVPDRCTAKAVESLIVVTDHTQIMPLVHQERKDLLLDGVRVLVLVDHQVREFGAHFFQDLGTLLQEAECLVLNSGEIERVVFLQLNPIEIDAFGQNTDLGFGGGCELGYVDCFLRNLVEPLHQCLGLDPRRSVVLDQEGNIWDRAILPDSPIQKVAGRTGRER
jgi:hypothetical protein